MKSTTLVQLIALPAVLAGFAAELTIVVRDNVYGASVVGKADPSGEVITMDSGTPGIDQNLKCVLDDLTWSSEGEKCQQRPMYRQVGYFNFSQPTKDPRPFVLRAPPSWGESLKTQICGITVTGEGKDVYHGSELFWGAKSNQIEVLCGDDLTWTEGKVNLESGTESERKIEAELERTMDEQYSSMDARESTAVARQTQPPQRR